MSIDITYDTALAALEAAVEEKGEGYVYTPETDDMGFSSCQYLHLDDKGDLNVPGCLVGHAMLTLGVPREELVLFNTGNDAHDLIGGLKRRKVLGVVDPKAADLFQVAQGKQDALNAWGTSLRRAKDIVSNREIDGLYAEEEE